MSRRYLLLVTVFTLLSTFTFAQKKVDLSKATVKKGLWHGEFIYNSGFTFPITIEITKSKKGGFEGSLYWYNYFNTKCKIKGDLTKSKPEFIETNLIYGKAMDFGEYVIESVENNVITGYSENDETGKKDASFRIVHESDYSSEELVKIEKAIKASQEKYGEQKFTIINDEKLQTDVLQNIKDYSLKDTIYNKPLTFTGSMTQGPQLKGELEGTFELPNNFYMVIKIMGFEVISGRNEKESWTYSTVDKKLNIKDLNKKDDDMSMWESDIHAMLDSGFQVRNFGEGVVNGQDCYRIVIEKGMDYKGYYFSKEHYRIVKEESNNGLEFTKGYIKDDIFILQSVEEVGMDSKTKMTFDEFKFNQTIDSTIFYPSAEMLENVKEEVADQVKGADYFNDLGIEHYKNGEFEKAKAQFDNAIRKSRNNATFFANRGRANLELQNYYEAISDYNQSNQLHTEVDYANYYYLGLAKYNLKDFKSSVIDFKEALKGDKKNINRLNYNYVGMSYYHMNEIDSALVYLKLCSEQEDAIGQDYYNYAYILREADQLETSVAFFKKATELDPEMPGFHNHYGITLYRLGEYEKAKDAFTKAVELNDEVLDFTNNLANSYMEMGDTENALKYFLKVEKRVDEPNASLSYNIGQCYHHSGDYIKAMEYYNKAISLNSSKAEFYDARAYLKKINNDKKGAIQDFTTSINLYDKDPVIYYERGLLQQELHNKQSSCEDFNKAAELGHKEAKKMVEENCNYKDQ